MAWDPAPYRRELGRARETLRRSLAGGTDSPFTVAVLRRTVAIMESDLDTGSASLRVYDHLPPEGGFGGPELWHVKSRRIAARPFERRQLEPDQWLRKNSEYEQLVRSLRAPGQRAEAFVDRQRGFAYLVQENPRVNAVLEQIVRALGEWFAAHSGDEDFMSVSARSGLYRMLEERDDLLAALRLAQTLPKDTEVSRVPIERPFAVEVIEIGIGCIPYLGNAVALYEVHTGHDLFGYELDELERVVLAVTVLVPVVSRLFKGGRAMYTAGRLSRMHGGDVGRWSASLGTAERAAADSRGMRALREAGALAQANRAIDAKLGAEVVEGLERMGLKRATAPSSDLPRHLSDALRKLISSKGSLAELDELALQRVIEKSPGLDSMRGQLLEELLESRIASWLRDPAGVAALGVPRPSQGLEFIPGHLVRDASNRQVTDGLLGYRDGPVFHVVAIFEAKAGQRGVRDLRLSQSSIASLSQADREELRSYARDIYRERVAAARRAGNQLPRQPAEETLEKIEREISLSERGGQVMHDFERLHPNESANSTTLLIGGEPQQVFASPRTSKVFGVLPKDVRPGRMEQDLAKMGYRFEALGLNISAAELVELAKSLRAVAPL